MAVVASLVWPQEMLQWELYAEFSTTDPTRHVRSSLGSEGQHSGVGRSHDFF